jgi:hypothetical protein
MTVAALCGIALFAVTPSSARVAANDSSPKSVTANGPDDARLGAGTLALNNQSTRQVKGRELISAMFTLSIENTCGKRFKLYGDIIFVPAAKSGCTFAIEVPAGGGKTIATKACEAPASFTAFDVHAVKAFAMDD